MYKFTTENSVNTQNVFKRIFFLPFITFLLFKEILSWTQCVTTKFKYIKDKTIHQDKGVQINKRFKHFFV